MGLTPLAVAPPPPTPTDEVLLLPVLLLLLLLLAVESRRSACSFTHVSPKALAKWSSTEKKRNLAPSPNSKNESSDERLPWWGEGATWGASGCPGRCLGALPLATPPPYGASGTYLGMAGPTTIPAHPFTLAESLIKCKMLQAFSCYKRQSCPPFHLHLTSRASGFPNAFHF